MKLLLHPGVLHFFPQAHIQTYTLHLIIIIPDPLSSRHRDDGIVILKNCSSVLCGMDLSLELPNYFPCDVHI